MNTCIDKKFIPRLIDFTQNFSDIHNIVDILKKQAIKEDGYWTFNTQISSENNYIDDDVIVSNKWRLMCKFVDAVMLAKLMGYEYKSYGRRISLPNFNSEDTYWITFLQIVKPPKCKEMSFDLYSDLSKCNPKGTGALLPIKSILL